MNESFFYFILGLLVAIPLSIAGNILTPTFQNWWAQFSYKRSIKRVKQLKAELNRLTLLSTKKEDLILESLRAMVAFIFFSSAVVVCFLIFFSAQGLGVFGLLNVESDILYTAMALTLIIFVPILIRPLVKVLRDIRLIENIEEHVEETNELINKLLPESEKTDVPINQK